MLACKCKMTKRYYTSNSPTASTVYPANTGPGRGLDLRESLDGEETLSSIADLFA